MVKIAYQSNTFANNITNKMETQCWTLELELIGQDNCVRQYKIVNDSSGRFIKGEVAYDLKLNTVTISVVRRDIYDKFDLPYVGNLQKCGKKWRGPAIYTSDDYQGEIGTLQFWFA